MPGREPGSGRPGPRRGILRAFDTRHQVLPESVRQMVFGKNYTRPTLNGPLPPYAPAEWNRLIDLCKQEVRRLGEAQRAMVALAEGGQDPAVGGWSEVNGAWLMLRVGPVTRTEVAAHLGLTPRTFTGQHRGIERARAALFPSHKDAIPYMLLLAAWTGIVPDGLTGLEVSGIRWTGRQATLLSYTKGRTADESLVLSPRASRLLEQWVQHSALLRGHAPAELAEHVWLVTRQGRLARAAFEEYMMRGWVKAHDLRGDDGGLLRIDRRRLRTTFIAQRGQRQWSLRATVDPNHSPQVEGDHYLSAATPAQKAVVEEIARDAQGDLLRRASAPLVVDEVRPAPPGCRRKHTASGWPRAPWPSCCRVSGTCSAGPAPTTSPACTVPKGQPCPARPWVCLLCPLALFAPRHLPNLLRLKAFFARQFRQMPREQFAAVFAPYARRLSADILPRFEKAAIAAVQRDVGDEDAELPLRAEETTS